MKHAIIGIDTGGTYTDAVLLDASTRAILSRAKVPTSHHNLADGIATALHQLMQDSSLSPETVTSVAVSSTLATNAVVENKGARVAVLAIGYVKHFRLPVKAVLFLKGGHSITGEEEQPLDLDYLVSLIHNLREEVDAYGICAAMSMKNPAHELVAEKAISMIDPKPVFCSHRISDIAGMEERAATAGLHAKLMPLMEEFTDGVETALKHENLSAPINIVGGNGTLLPAHKAVEQAGMTVASGPACTAIFGLQHSSGNCLVVDVGGTTTDITMIQNGKPLLTEKGCTVGKWRTHVEAIDMFTRGIGGDSHVQIRKDGTLSIGPQRVTPIAMASGTTELRSWLDRESKCFELTGNERRLPEDDTLVNTLAEYGPCTLSKLKETTGLGPIHLEKRLEDLARKQLIVERGFTPTDALHVLNRLELGDRKKALEAAAILGGFLDLSGEEFAARVVETTCELIEDALLEYLTSHFFNSSPAILSHRDDHPVLDIRFSLKLPLVGIGAASRCLLPQVAEKLRTSVHFPENYEVGNAIGAAILAAENGN